MKGTTQNEDGFTLVELIIAIVLMALVTGAVSGAFVTAMSGSASTSQRVRESNDAQLIATYLTRDAQAAGGTNPSTGTADETIGVSLTDPAACPNPTGTLVLRLSWTDRATPTTKVSRVANYSYDSTNKQLVRRTCTNGVPGAVLTFGDGIDAAHGRIAAVSAACVPAAECPGLPDSVSLTIVTTNSPLNASTPYTYTLGASLRPQAQTLPDVTNSSPIPLFILGGDCPGLEMSGSVSVRVYGDTVINMTDQGSCSAMSISGSGTIVTGGVSILGGGTCADTGSAHCPSPIGSYPTSIADPFAGLTPPGTCPGPAPAPPSGSNPVHYHPGTYASTLSISGSGSSVFDPGTYIFCNGVNITGSSTITGTGVLWYIAGGSISFTGSSTITLTAPSTGSYAGLVIWQAAADHNSMNFPGSVTAHINGTLYAPGAAVGLSGSTGTSYQTVVARSINLSGSVTLGVGNPPANPLVINAPAALPAWTRGRPYPDTQIVSTGGSGAGLLWSATNLPVGLSIDAETGIISGTTAVAGTRTVTVKVVDSLGDTDSRSYSLTINDLPTVSGPVSLPAWTVGRPFPSTAFSAAGGTTPLAWSATGLPAGMTFNPATHAIAGTPSVAGTRTIVVTITDAAGAVAIRNYSITINSALSVATTSLPDGEQGVPYSTTLAASGGTGTSSWTSTALPAGLTLNGATGVISGTPTATGTTSFTVTVTDAAGATANRSLSILRYARLTITTPVGPALPPWTVDRPYASTTVVATGGTGTYSWAATNLPPGMTINAATGVISGTPTAAGSFTTIVVTVTDTANPAFSDPQSYTMVINPHATITTTSASVRRTRALNVTLAATGGTGTDTWSMVGAPAWVVLNASTGKLTGTAPNTTGVATFTIRVTDATGDPVSATFTLTVTN